ncbi:MAG: ribonuclease III [Erysipelotrichales bacterium]
MNYCDYLLSHLNIEIKDPKLIEQALIHPSYANEINKVHYNYERLEFMGDAILQFLISDFIYKKYEDIDEGKLTVLRAKAVREESLAAFANEYELYNYIKVGRGEQKSGGVHKASVLSNVFEAIIGAIYLSNGLDDVSKFLKIVYDSINTGNFSDVEDYKTRLQEYVQADNKRTVSYDLIESSGTSNQPYFKFMVKMDDLILGYGEGNSKKKAQQSAAKDALEKLAQE